MRIGELATKTGVSTRLLRYYESQGLLSPDRESNGYRTYADSAVSRVTQVRDLIEAGIPTDVIRDMKVCLDECADPLSAPVIAKEIADALALRRAQLLRRIGCLGESADAIALYLERATILD